MASERCPVHDRIVKTVGNGAYSVHGHVDCDLCAEAESPEWQELVKQTADAVDNPPPSEGQPGDGRQVKPRAKRKGAKSMPRIPHVIGWALILAGVGIYVYEANLTGPINPTLEKLESVVPGNLGLDLPLFLAGAAIITLT